MVLPSLLGVPFGLSEPSRLLKPSMATICLRPFLMVVSSWQFSLSKERSSQRALVQRLLSPEVRFSSPAAPLITALTFSKDDPLSWNFDEVFAKFDLAPKDDILPGGGSLILGLPDFGVEGGEVFAPAASVNVGGAGLVAGASDGIFVFLEDTAFVPGGGFTNPGLGTFVGSEWLRDVEIPDGLLPPNEEGIAAFTDQTVNTSAIILTPAQIAALDAIAAAAFNFTGPFSAGGYTPTGLGAGTGDFNSDLSSENYIITSGVLPEPSSLLMPGLGAGLLVWYSRRKVAPVC